MYREEKIYGNIKLTQAVHHKLLYNNNKDKSHSYYFSFAIDLFTVICGEHFT